ncbi:MAG: hypothetical protein HQL23_09220, partial [Candidatus Omnitrophica bacterium]|nr:hypothetical protein [Candidatus Omnitrophota bacterium]
AEAFILFSRIAAAAKQNGAGRELKSMLDIVDQNAGLQRSWLTENILPRFNGENSVVISGMQELHDIRNIPVYSKKRHGQLEYTFYAPTLSTNSHDTLAFIRAYREMNLTKDGKLPPAVLRKLIKALEATAGVFGVKVNGKSGLDWTQPQGRWNAVSADMTAEFYATARVIEETMNKDQAKAAAGAKATPEAQALAKIKAFAESALSGLARENSFTETVMPPPPTGKISYKGEPTGVNNYFLVPKGDGRQGFNDYKIAQGAMPQWAVFPAAAAKVLLSTERQATTQKASSFIGQLTAAANNDVTQFCWFIGLALAGLIIWHLILSSIHWIIARENKKLRKDEKNLRDNQVVSDEVMMLAEKRWALRILSIMSVPGPNKVGNNQYAMEGSVEGNFGNRLKAFYKLVLGWRVQVQPQQWNVDLTHQTIEDLDISGFEDGYVHGLDEFILIVGFFIRRIIKEGYKDSAYSYDSNHIWSRMEIFISPYFLKIRELLADRRKTGADTDKIDGQIEAILKELGIEERGSLPLYAANSDNLSFLQEVLQNELMTARTDGEVRLRSILRSYGAGMDTSIQVQPGLDPPYQEIVGLDRGRFYRVLAYVLTIGSEARKFNTFARINKLDANFKKFLKAEYGATTPKHHWLIELAKMMPHLLVVGLLSIMVYNHSVGGASLISFAFGFVGQLVVLPLFVVALKLFLCSLLLSFLGTLVDTGRYDPAQVFEGRKDKFLWNPMFYNHASHIMRAAAFVVLAIAMLSLPTVSFGQQALVQWTMIFLVFAEVAGVVFSYFCTAYSRWTQTLAYEVEYPALGQTHCWLWKLVSLRFLPNSSKRFLTLISFPEVRPMSVLGDSLRYYLSPSAFTGGFFGMVMMIVNYALLVGAFAYVGGFIIGPAVVGQWFVTQYLIGTVWFKVLGGAIIFIGSLYLTRFALFNAQISVAAAFVTWPVKVMITTVCVLSLFGVIHLPILTVAGIAAKTARWILPGILMLAIFLDELLMKLIKKYCDERIKKQFDMEMKRAGAPKRVFNIIFTGGDAICTLGRLNADQVIQRWYNIRNSGSAGIRAFRQIQHIIGGIGDETIEAWIRELHELEIRDAVTLWTPGQIVVGQVRPDPFPAENYLIYAKDQAQRQRLLKAFQIRSFLFSMQSAGGQSQESGPSLAAMALAMHEELKGVQIVFHFISNKYAPKDNNPLKENYSAGTEFGQRAKFIAMIDAFTGHKITGKVIHDWTPFASKAACMTGMDGDYAATPHITNTLIMDRGININDMDNFMLDCKKSLGDRDMVIVVTRRGTVPLTNQLGQAMQMVEEGHGECVKGNMMMGGRGGEAVGTGWGNILQNVYWEGQKALMLNNYPTLPMTARERVGMGMKKKAYDSRFGVIGFIVHAVGISEDIWVVQQIMHTVIALGGNAKISQGQAFWHKIRESATVNDWFAAMPRWSGGFPQKKLDPIMQNVFDFGPMSIFSKEIRDNNGRFFLSAPFAFMFIVTYPVAIIYGFLPFVGVMIVLAWLGLCFNQILTLNGLIAYMEAYGFNRPLAVAFGAGAILLACFTSISIAPMAMPLIMMFGGFLEGITRWLSTRLRDMIMFPTLLLCHVLGQTIRQSLEFVLSGAKADNFYSVEQREWSIKDKYKHFVSSRTTIKIGKVILLMNVVALFSLDMLNLILLAPTLLFAIGAVIGPYMSKTYEGADPGFIKKNLAAMAGFAAAAVIMSVLSLIVFSSIPYAWFAHILLFVLGGIMFAYEWKFADDQDLIGNYRQLSPWEKFVGIPGLLSQLLARVICKMFGRVTDIGSNDRGYRKMTDKEIRDCLTAKDGKGKGEFAIQHKANRRGMERLRMRSEFWRNFVLGVFILLLFYIVPIPGLIVFQTAAARISLTLPDLMMNLGGVVAIMAVSGFLYYLLSGIFTWFATNRFERIYKGYETVENRWFNSSVLLNETDRLLAAKFRGHMADIMIYIEQKSEAFAHRSMNAMEEMLRKYRHQRVGTRYLTSVKYRLLPKNNYR